VFQLNEDHGAILVFVVQLEDFHEIFVAAGISVLLNLGVDGEEILEGNHLYLPLLLASDLLNDLQGWVKLEGAKTVSEVEAVDLVIAFEVVDGKGKLYSFEFFTTDT